MHHVSRHLRRALRRIWLAYKLRRQLAGEPFDRDFSLLLDREDER